MHQVSHKIVVCMCGNPNFSNPCDLVDLMRPALVMQLFSLRCSSRFGKPQLRRNPGESNVVAVRMMPCLLALDMHWRLVLMQFVVRKRRERSCPDIKEYAFDAIPKLVCLEHMPGVRAHTEVVCQLQYQRCYFMTPVTVTVTVTFTCEGCHGYRCVPLARKSTRSDNKNHVI